jgi:adenosine deaminase
MDAIAHFRSKFLDEFLRAIPKTDLHVHLDGSLRLGTLIELAREQGVELPSYDEVELRALVFKDSFVNLEEYLTCFKYTCAVMQNYGAVERVSYEFAVDNFSENVKYFEVRFAPQLHASPDADGGFGVEEVIHAVNNGLRRATDEFNARIDPAGIEPPFKYGILVSAMRNFPPDCKYYLALRNTFPYESNSRISSIASATLIRIAAKCKYSDNVPIVGLDVAGPENGYPNRVHKEAFDLASEYFINKTVHAGEDYGPQSIFQAVRDLHADRIGHGFHLFSSHLVRKRPESSGTDINDVTGEEFVRRLTKFVCDRRICMEVCLTSNMNTMPGLTDLTMHPISEMLRNEVSVSLCTDNRLVSSTSVVDEFRKAILAFELRPSQVRYIALNGFKRCFFDGSYTDKIEYFRAVAKYYDYVAEKHGVVTEEADKDAHKF